MTTIEATDLVEQVDHAQVLANIDEQARARLGMSGAEFLARLRSDDVSDLDHTTVVRLRFAAQLIGEE